jgi:photosystem II stability/assembly factor-like uncharacterized protein
VEADLLWTGTWGNNIGASDNGGESIAPLHNGLETLSGLDLLWHPTPGQVTLATIQGLYRTDDHGRSWFQLPGPLAQQTVYSLLQENDGAIWAGATDGLWVSRDYGATWSRVDGFPQATVVRLGRLTVPQPRMSRKPPFDVTPYSPLVYAPRQWLWVGTETAGLWLSQDSGATWHFAGLAGAEAGTGRTVYNLFFDPGQLQRLVAATDLGIFVVAVPQSRLLSLASHPLP